MGKPPTVCVVDDDAAVRRSLCWLIEGTGRRVQAFESAAAFLDGYDGSRPCCLVLDVRLPGQSGLDLQQQLTARGMQIPVIIITGHGDVQMAVRAFKGGAVDFIEKPFQNEVLLDRVQHALELDTKRTLELAETEAIRERLIQLSPREREVMNLVVRGKLNKQIAADLGISEKTVEIHRANVMRKVRVESVAELVRTVHIAGQETVE